MFQWCFVAQSGSMHPCSCTPECGCQTNVPEPPKCDNSAVPKVKTLRSENILSLWLKSYFLFGFFAINYERKVLLNRRLSKYSGNCCSVENLSFFSCLVKYLHCCLSFVCQVPCWEPLVKSSKLRRFDFETIFSKSRLLIALPTRAPIASWTTRARRTPCAPTAESTLRHAPNSVQELFQM